jgi:hypothetical protein
VRKIFLLSVASILISFFFTTTVQAAVTWSETQPGGNADHPWTPVAMSIIILKKLEDKQELYSYNMGHEFESWDCWVA